MSLFKKKDEDRKKAYAPTGDAKEKAGASGKGGGEPAKPKYDPKSKDFAGIIEKRNNDGNFGYGYVDENTGIEVPWYIDMINGGGANAAGSEFVSPFAELPFEGGMLSAPSKIGNSMKIAPYGFNQPRKYAQAGMVGYPELPAAPAPSVSGGPSVSAPKTQPNIFGIGDETVTQRSRPDMFDDEEVQLPAGLMMNQPAYTMPSAIGVPQMGNVGVTFGVTPSQNEAMLGMPSVDEMRAYLAKQNIFTDYMPSDLVADMYKMQRGLK